ncbi:MAG: S-layer homology domain-containing protein, partial [Clostridiales bacterium]
MPQYAVDGGAKALLPNTAINRMTITMNIPSGMNIDANTRIKHIGSDGRVDYLIPKINGSIFSFTVTKFSTFSIIADSSIAQVTYHLQGGDASGIKDGKTVVYYAQDDGMRLPIPTCEKYKFVGWYDKDSTKGQEYLKISAGLPKHLYAVWETKTTLKVSFRLIGDWPHDNGVRGHDHYITWIKTDTYPLEAGATVGDLFKMVCDQKGLDYQGFSSNYISSIQAPTEFGGYWLSEFDSGPNSGWMYTINGDHPNRGLTAWTLQDGDEVIWHYVDDYKEEAYFLGNPTKYPNRWLEAEDITPSQYLSKYGAPILSVGMGGTVSPTGDLSPYIGKNVTFTITPNAGYQVKNVVVDGKSMGVIGSYAYKNLQFTSRINVTFEPVKATIRFADMPIDHWAYSYVAYLTDKGVISGMTEELFGSNHKVKRGDFITMLARMSGDILPAYTGKFTDVSSGVYYASAVAWAVNSGVASGMSSTLFAPDKLIIRQDMAMMLSRYAAYKGINLPNNYAQVSFGDQDKISVYALDAVLKMQRSGILNGYENGNFLPLGDATRAEAAKMMTMLDQLK